MKQLLKRALQAVAPGVAADLSAWRSRRMFRQRFEAFQGVVRARLYPDGEVRVLSGPFAGMRYLDEIVWGSITPKWLGVYEAALAPVIETVIRQAPDCIVDVGSAEGYYAVGLARRLPTVPVHSFDSDRYAREQQARLAGLNGVRNLHLGQFCTHEDLCRLLGGRSFVLCDIEGWEVQLLDPVRAPALATAALLVEVHRFEDAGVEQVGAELRRRFDATHVVERIDPPEPLRGDAAMTISAGRLDAALAEEAVSEHRGYHQHWLWMQPRAA